MELSEALDNAEPSRISGYRWAIARYNDTVYVAFRDTEGKQRIRAFFEDLAYHVDNDDSSIRYLDWK